MNRLATGALLAALPLTAALSSPAPAVGPGGVVAAVAALARAADAGDADALGTLVVAADPAPVFGVTAEGGIEQLEAVSPDAFVDVDASGAAVAFTDERAYVAGLLGSIRTAKDGATLLRTEVRSVLANCAAERCSWAIVDLVREYGESGKVTRRIPLRATALLRYTPQGFRVFHWHASPRTAAH